MSSAILNSSHATDTRTSPQGDTGVRAVNRATTTSVGNPPTTLARKKLPWLENARSTTRTTDPKTPGMLSTPVAEENTSANAHADLLFDEVRSDGGAPKKFAISPPDVYASSEYSTTPSDADSLPPEFSKKDPASYEKVVATPVIPSGPPASSRFVEHWLVHGARPTDASTLPSDAFPRAGSEGTKILKSASGSRGKQASGMGHQRCGSCEAALQPRDMSDARGQRPQAKSPKNPQKPIPKRQTLQELPLHLVAHSSSSSQSNTSRQLDILKRAVVQAQTRKTSVVAANGLEDLREDAVDITNTITSTSRGVDRARVSGEDPRVLHRVSTVRNAITRPRPRALSSPESMHSSDSTQDGISPNATPIPRKGPSRHTFTAVNVKGGSTRIPEMPSQPRTNSGLSNAMRTPAPDGRSKRQLDRASEAASITRTPPKLYQPQSASSNVRDFAYDDPNKRRMSVRSEGPTDNYGAAASFYGDHGQSVNLQPGNRQSIWGYDKQLPALPEPVQKRHGSVSGKGERVHRAHVLHHRKKRDRALSADNSIDPKEQSPRSVKRVQTGDSFSIPPSLQEKLDQEDKGPSAPKKHESYFSGRWHTPAFMQSAYYREADGNKKSIDSGTDASEPPPLISSHNWSLKHPRRSHLSIAEGQGFSLGRYHKRQPIAREWNMRRKRLTATIACLNTIFTGLIAGIYAGEVPRIQYQLGDMTHWVIFGNMLFFAGMGLTTLIFWPLPLLHGRRPYTLIAFGLMLPFHIPQALAVSLGHGPAVLYQVALLLSRALTGLALGFANINLLPTLFDLFGASLMSEKPHQEVVAYDDVRRQGGGIGVWLGIWTFCFTSSLSIGFCIGACIISTLNPSWGFWIIIMLLAFFLLVNVIAPETRKSAYRRSVHHFYDHADPEKIRRRVARGEVKLHISNDGPRYWWEEVWAGLILTKRMVLQPGYFVLMLYLGWIYAQLTLVILLLGALLSREYQWASYYIGLAALAVPIGAAIAMPLTKASWLSRARVTPPRTDSMTMRQPRFTWTSHFLRRIIFSVLLPFAGLAYCMTSPGPPLNWAACVIFAGFMGFLTDLAIAECIGLIMETFDTSDIQPGVNTKHRLQSMSDLAKRRRTNYSSFPRVCAAFFAAQSLGFFLAAAVTVVSGRMTNSYGAQLSMYVVAAILLGVTLLFFIIIARWKDVQVIPDRKEPWGSSADPDWKPVVIGNPSGKMRRVNLLEMGTWSRWSEIRRLNKLM